MPALEFRDPLLLLLVLLAVPVFLLARRAPGRVLFSSFKLLPSEARGWRARLAWLPDALLALSLVALVVALARRDRHHDDPRHLKFDGGVGPIDARGRTHPP